MSFSAKKLCVIIHIVLHFVIVYPFCRAHEFVFASQRQNACPQKIRKYLLNVRLHGVPWVCTHETAWSAVLSPLEGVVWND